MTTIEIIKVAGPYVTAITSLLVALLVVYLNYRNQQKSRKEIYRQEVYKRMLDAYEVIYSNAVEIHNSYSNIPSYLDNKVSANTGDLITNKKKYLMYLSPPVSTAIDQFIESQREGENERIHLLDNIVTEMKKNLGTMTLIDGLPEIFGVRR